MDSPTPNPLEGKIDYEYGRFLNWLEKRNRDRKRDKVLDKLYLANEGQPEDKYFEQYA